MIDPLDPTATDTLFRGLLAQLARTEPAPTRPPGARVGPLTIEGVLGQGGMGVVYRARTADGSPRALKTAKGAEESGLAGLRLEIRVLRALDHPAVVPVLEHGEHEGLPWYAMPLLEAPDLRGWLTGAEAPLTEKLRLLQRVCAGLDYLHGAGVVHRDLKPGNILVTDAGPVIIDFGLMAPFGGDRRAREQVQTTGRAAGTLAYMAPEQIRGELADPRTDLYAVGCMLYELLTGRAPFSADSASGWVEAHLEAAPALDPLPEDLRGLVGALLAKRPSERPSHAGLVARRLAARTGESPPVAGAYLHRPALSGREDALAQLDAALDALADGRGGVVLVTGESGVGKTRLTTEWSARAVDRDLTVLAGTCGDPAPLAGLRRPLQAIADRCRARGPAFTEQRLGAAAGPLAEHHPAFRELPGAEAGLAGLPPELAFRRLADAVLQVLALAAEPRGLVLITDDADQADPLTERLLNGLGPRLAAHRVLWICTWCSDRRAPPDFPRVELDRLGLRAVGGMMRDMLATDAVPGALARAVARDAHGNPFFIGEQLRAAIEAGRLVREDAGWRWLGQPDALAANLQTVLTERIQRLEPRVRAVAACAALLGREVPRTTLAALVRAAGVDAPFEQALEALRRRAVLEPRGDGLRFVHAGLRDGLLADLSAHRRAELHARAAAVLGPDAPPEQRAVHQAGAGWTAQAASAWAEAGRAHQHRGAFADALRAFDQATELTGCPLTVRLEALEVVRIADASQLEARARAVLAAAHAAGDGVVEARVTAQLGWQALEAGELADAEAHLTRAESIQSALGDWAGRGQTRSGLGALAAARGATEAAVERYLAARDDFDRAGDLRGEARVYNNLAIVWEGRRELQRARDGFRAAREFAHQAGDDWLAAIARLNTATMDHQLGRPDKARAGYRAALAVFEAVGHSRWTASCLTYQATLALEHGEALDPIEAALERALALHAESGAVYRAVTLAALGHLDLARGGDGRARLTEVRALLAEQGIDRDTPNEYGAVLARLEDAVEAR